ncbi:hypothetical protein ACFX2I_003953 [Malus domestica]
MRNIGSRWKSPKEGSWGWILECNYLLILHFSPASTSTAVAIFHMDPDDEEFSSIDELGTDRKSYPFPSQPSDSLSFETLRFGS